jgi:nucleotide-binding universal stress UspA family protein
MSRARRLLVAYDGSSAARRALLRAAEVARRGDSVSVVNVIPEPGVSSRLAPYVEERARQARLLDEAQRCLAREGIVARRIAAVGSAATEIVAAARRLGADMIIVGRRRTLVSRFLNSPSTRIVRRASCDVLVVDGSAAADDELDERPPAPPRWAGWSLGDTGDDRARAVVVPLGPRSSRD